MAKIEELEQYKAQQRRLALLALLADQPKATTDCMADEQMASLVEGSLTQQETEQCMAHLAQCDRCSGLWVQLDQEWQRQERQEQRNKRRKLQKKPRPFTLIGSLLAAAASVAVFVTITTRVDRKTAHLPAPLPARQQEWVAAPAAPAEKAAVQDVAPVPSSPQQQEIAAAADKTTVAPVAASVPQTDISGHDQQSDALTKKKEMVAMSATPTGQQPLLASQPVAVAEKAAPAPLAAAAEPMARMGKPAAAPPAAAVGGAPALSLATWQEQLRHDCTRPPMPEQLATLAAQGRQLLAAAGLDEADRQRVRTLLEPLEGPQEVETRCKVMLELLGPVAPAP